MEIKVAEINREAAKSVTYRNGREPIMEFRDIGEAVASLKEWQQCLGLEDWIIMVALSEPCEMEMQDVAAECIYKRVNKTAVIRIVLPKYSGERITKYCAEKLLVHELLHPKLAMLETGDEGHDDLLHQTQEDIAKALIMAKYDIRREFFSNVQYEG